MPCLYRGGAGRVRRFRAKRQQLEASYGRLPEIKGHDVALTVLSVPYLLVSGPLFADGEQHPGREAPLPSEAAII